MLCRLEAKDIYQGVSNARYSSDHGERFHVLGGACGPMLLCAHALLEEAFDEWDERHGERVDVVADATTLADYEGDTVEERIEDAMSHGDIRVNDGGTMVWVDPYEWCRSFRTGREAGQYFRTYMDR